MNDQGQEDVGVKAEQLSTLRQAADALGLPYFKLQRAARLGLFPTFTLLNDRPSVRISDVVACIERSRRGGER